MAEPEQTLASFIGTFPTRSYQKGEIIVFQGEAPRNTFIVKSGIVKSYNLSVNGDEKPMSFYGPQGVFPAPWTFKKAANAFYYYEAFTDCAVHFVPRDDYVAFLKANPDIQFAALESYITEHIGMTMRLNALQHSRASDKLLYTLHYLTLTQGHEIAPRVVEIKLNLTHQDFANLTGLTRETTATELNRLKAKGVITYGKHTLYQVKLDKLHETINDQFIADIQLKV